MPFYTLTMPTINESQHHVKVWSYEKIELKRLTSLLLDLLSILKEDIFNVNSINILVKGRILVFIVYYGTVKVQKNSINVKIMTTYKYLIKAKIGGDYEHGYSKPEFYLRNFNTKFALDIDVT